MRRRPVLALAVTALLAVLASYAAASVAAPRDRKAPRMVAATMVDGDGDHRADRVRLAYSERVRHARDTDGTYPLRVTGYRIKAIGASSGKVVVVLLEEKGVADADAKPAVGYRKTSSKPVRDAAGNQAAAQVFRGTGAHGNVEPPPPLRPPTRIRTATATRRRPTVRRTTPQCTRVRRTSRTCRLRTRTATASTETS